MNIVIANTKGGVGKTIVSTQVLPAYFVQCNNTKNINIYEIDNNNKSSLQNSSLNFKTLNLDKGEEALLEADYNVDSINIVDAGGGDDTRAVLNYIQKNDILVDLYLVPVLSDYEQVHNLKQTINLIRQIDNNASVYVVLNKLKSLEEQDIKDQFIFLFGSERYGIEGHLEEVQGDINGMLFLLDSNIYSILKNIYQKSLADILDLAEDYINNIREYKRKWREELSVEEYKKNMQFYSFLKDAKELAEINKKQLEKIEELADV